MNVFNGSSAGLTEIHLLNEFVVNHSVNLSNT